MLRLLAQGLIGISLMVAKEWAKKFRLTFPILDDSKGRQIYNYFGNGIVPYNVVIDRNGRLIYSDSGFTKEDIVNAIELGLKITKTKTPKKINKGNYKTKYQELRKIKFTNSLSKFLGSKKNRKID